MTAATQAPVLLVESDENVIKDVTCSLRLIDIPVISALSVEDAFTILKERSPAVVMARLRVGDDPKAALTIAEELSKTEEYAAIPVFALCTSGEQQSLDATSDLPFAGEIALPVEFPAFPERVRAILNADARSVPQGEISPAEVVHARVERHDIPEVAPQREVDSAVKDRNFAVAYSIQSKVLRELEIDGRINHAKVEQVAGIVNQITAKVCVRYATEKFL